MLHGKTLDACQQLYALLLAGRWLLHGLLLLVKLGSALASVHTSCVQASDAAEGC
jgi:hypothetical protein